MTLFFGNSLNAGLSEDYIVAIYIVTDAKLSQRQHLSILRLKNSIIFSNGLLFGIVALFVFVSNHFYFLKSGLF